MQENKPLPILIKGIEFKPDAAGMYNLTAMHKELELPDAKAPRKWNNSIKRHLANRRNFGSSEGNKGGTYATERGTIAYAMWVSPEFYSLVVDTFIAVRNNALASAIAQAAIADEYKSLLKQNARMVNRFSKWISAKLLNWDKSALLAGINNPYKAKQSMLDKGYLRTVGRLHCGKQITEYLPTEKGRNVGISSRYMGWNGDQFHFTKEGREWLSRMSDQINECTNTIRK